MTASRTSAGPSDIEMTDTLKAGLTANFLHHLQTNCGMESVRDMGDGRYAGLVTFLFTSAIIVGRIGNREEYDDRWCYHDHEAAKEALDAWDGQGEPSGWHRHPGTGRRRTEGDPETEYIAP